VRWLSNWAQCQYVVGELHSWCRRSGVEEAAKEMGRAEQEVDQAYLEPLKIFWTS
jgi:hypothetical protein